MEWPNLQKKKAEGSKAQNSISFNHLPIGRMICASQSASGNLS